MGSHSARVLEALSSDNIESLCLEKECREQEEYFGTHFIVEILERAECSCRGMRKVIRKETGDISRSVLIEGSSSTCISTTSALGQITGSNIRAGLHIGP